MVTNQQVHLECAPSLVSGKEHSCSSLQMYCVNSALYLPFPYPHYRETLTARFILYSMSLIALNSRRPSTLTRGGGGGRDKAPLEALDLQKIPKGTSQGPFWRFCQTNTVNRSFPAIPRFSHSSQSQIIKEMASIIQIKRWQTSEMARARPHHSLLYSSVFAFCRKHLESQECCPLTSPSRLLSW